MDTRRDKDTYPGLFRPGFTEVDFANLDHVFAPGQSSPRRKMLTAQLRMLIKQLQGLGVHGDMWIDGSFSTQNPNPMDYDVLLVVPRIVLSAMKEPDQEAFGEITDPANHDYIKMKWGCDLYVCEASDLATQRKFESFFSNNPDSDNKKGIAVVKI